MESQRNCFPYLQCYSWAQTGTVYHLLCCVVFSHWKTPRSRIIINFRRHSLARTWMMHSEREFLVMVRVNDCLARALGVWYMRLRELQGRHRLRSYFKIDISYSVHDFALLLSSIRDSIDDLRFMSPLL